ncbi:hypothetical protein GFS31_17120 [Leptolyngbya sp. BL0902]|nr:hypothetical protein GFS31_17120 [Leptolyngbya sp. BL0902]
MKQIEKIDPKNCDPALFSPILQKSSRLDDAETRVLEYYQQ